MNPARTRTPEVTIAIVGAGRLGGVLARAFRHAGFIVSGPHARGERVPDADIALLCVPDDAIASAARAARDSAPLIGHVSGATTLADVDFSIHPLQTSTGGESPDVFRGIGCAVAGRTDADRAVAERLATALGAAPFTVDDSRRAAYHAAASLASNLVLAVLDAAEQLADAAGIRPDEARSLLAPLARRTVENWVVDGAHDALTGPVARGDEHTVIRQRAAVDTARPALTRLFDELVAATRTISATRAGAARTDDARASSEVAA